MNGTFTSSATRFDGAGGLPAVTTYDANHAYIQVLSHAGANYYRDPVDRRVIRNVINQRGAIIDSENQVGGYPTLPSTAGPNRYEQPTACPIRTPLAVGFNTYDGHPQDGGAKRLHLSRKLSAVDEREPLSGTSSGRHRAIERVDGLRPRCRRQL